MSRSAGRSRSPGMASSKLASASREELEKLFMETIKKLKLKDKKIEELSGERARLEEQLASSPPALEAEAQSLRATVTALETRLLSSEQQLRQRLAAETELLEGRASELDAQLQEAHTQLAAACEAAADLQAQLQVEREDLLADYRALSQQIKLKNLAIAAFIPPAYQDFIMARCRWNEYEEQWVIAGVQAAGGQPGLHGWSAVGWDDLRRAYTAEQPGG